MPSTPWREQLASARQVVVKIGTSALTDDRGRLDVPFLKSLAGQVGEAIRRGAAPTLVVSGAVGAGMAELDLPTRPRTLPMLQATAAIGQGQLMRHVHDAFAPLGVKVAQILVTRSDFEDRTRYLNIRNTIAALHEVSAVPVINENDTVAVDELRFGDNDIIAAHVANMLRAEAMVLLTVVDGVLAGGEVLDVIEDAGAARALDTGARSKLGSGGMGSKLAAARMVASAGEIAIIANGRAPQVLSRVLDGEKLGTLVVPAGEKMSSRRRWIGMASRAAGRIEIDAGAARALTEGGKSLLPSGVTAVRGDFDRGATVAIETAEGKTIARGLTNYAAAEIEKIKGLRTTRIAKALGEPDKPYDEIVHRNNMTLL